MYIASLKNGHVSLTGGKLKVRYAKITFSHNVPVYYVYTHTVSQVELDEEHLSGTDTILGYDIAQQDNTVICSKCFEGTCCLHLPRSWSLGRVQWPAKITTECTLK